MGALVGALVWAGAPSSAQAHGRFPEAGSIVVDPSDPDHLVARTTYGLLDTGDEGANWSWICPEGVGFDADKEDPAVVIMQNGTLVAGTFDGLSVSEDGCDYGFVPGDLADRYFVDVQAEPGFQSAVALSSNGVAADTFEVNLWESGDMGASWDHLGTSPPPDFLGLTLGVAPTDPNRLYITGRDGTEGTREGVVFRSDDRGETWTRYAVMGGEDGETLPYMGGVDPNDADTFYVANIRQEMAEIVYFGLLVTRDGGETWEIIFERNKPMAGFAISPDGSQLAVGGDGEGLWVADSTATEFTKVSDVNVGCITWTEAAMYVCADQFVDGYNIGKSTDGGATFTGISELSSPCGPPESCGTDTSIGDICPIAWVEESVELGSQCGPGATTSSSASGGAAPPAPAPSSGSCGCELPGQGGSRGASWPSWAMGIAAAAGVWLLRRR